MEKKVIKYLVAKGLSESTIKYILSSEKLTFELAVLIAEYERQVAKKGLVGKEAYDYFVYYQVNQNTKLKQNMAMK